MKVFSPKGSARNPARGKRPPERARKRKPFKAVKNQRTVSKADPDRRPIDWGRFKICLVGVVFALAWLGLWGRAYYVQVIWGPSLAERAGRQHVATEYVTGKRGQILDRNGRLLAKSVEFKSVYANPKEIVDVDTAALALSQDLGGSFESVRERLVSGESYVWIARQIGDRTARAVESEHLPGVYLTTEYGRQYPNKQLAGRLLGFVGLDDKGLEGVEASFDDRLAGDKAHLEVQRDAAGNRLYFDANGRAVDIDGKDVTLTLDNQIQSVAELALSKAVRDHNAKWGACLIVRVSSGEILAWAEYPVFNPNDYRKYQPGQWRNRIAIDALEPGSSIKPLLVAAALQEGVVDRESVFNCENGRWRVANKTIKDVSRRGWLPVNKIVRYSSNIGAAKIARSLGAEAYFHYLTELGFGSKTGLPLAGEGRGILRAPQDWAEIDLLTAGFGQGFAVTVLQMAEAYLCLANGGVRKPLRIVLDPAPEAQTPGSRVFSSEVVAQVIGMMTEVVEEDGSGTRAAIEGLEVAGKTSTAQKAEKSGGYGNRYTSSFVGIVPAKDPEFLAVVVVDEPKDSYYGGVVAAPVFREIMEKTLAYHGILPDVREQVVAQAGESPEMEPGPEPESVPVESFSTGTGGVPSVEGLSLRRAMELFAAKGVVPELKGQGLTVVKQSPAPGQPWPEGRDTQYILWLSQAEERL